MITIHITQNDLLNMRFTYSAVAEIAHSYRVLINPALHGPNHRWVEETSRALHDLQLPYLDSLIPRWRGCFPEFLLPTPKGIGASVDDGIRNILESPDEIVRQDVQELIEADGHTSVRQHFITHPRESLFSLTEEMRLYWQRALAHYWSRMLSVKEGDVLYRARLLALEGPGKLFTDLHPTLSYYPQQITIEPIPLSATIEGEMNLSGHGIQLVPVVITGVGRCFKIGPDGRSTLAYGVRGGGLWGQKPAGKSLELALGAARAAVLQTLVTPSSTGEITQKLGIASGGVSEHLKRLTQAGLAEPHRNGKRVYYQLTRRGEELIALFERPL